MTIHMQRHVSDAAAVDASVPDLTWITTVICRVENLSSRQSEVFFLLAEGLGNREIASRLHISQRTVKLHTTNLLRALHVDSRLQAGLVALAYIGTMHNEADSAAAESRAPAVKQRQPASSKAASIPHATMPEGLLGEPHGD